MTRGKLLNLIRAATPRPMRKLIGYAKHYLQRLGRWVVLLIQISGNTWRDELKLLASAAAAPVTSLRGLSSWQDPVLLFDADVVVRGVGAFRVRRRSDDLWHVLPWREAAIHRTMREVLRPGGVLVDAGANIGIYSVLGCRLVGSLGRVIAVEMMPDTAAILRNHVAGNGCTNVEVVEGALSDSSGKALLAFVTPGKYGQASVVHSNPEEGSPRQAVTTITLDEVCKGVDRIALLKLDLEGAELQALAGASAAIQRTERVIYEGHTNADALAAWFEAAGFTITRKFGKDRLAERFIPAADPDNGRPSRRGGTHSPLPSSLRGRRRPRAPR